MAEISVIYCEFSNMAGNKGLINNVTNKIVGKCGLNVDILRKNIVEFCANILPIFDDVATNSLNYELNKVELSLDISAGGEISLIGSIGVNVSNGIKLCFKKK